MKEEGNESRFICKLCHKKYPCVKSIGAHMRSHVIPNSAEFHEKPEFNPKKNSSSESGYVLRENPKKAWRAVDSRPPLPQEQVCKQCGKVFKSVKALCGHMASHSDKDRSTKDDNSRTSENHKVAFDSQSDSEVMKLRTRSSKTKRYKKTADDSPSSAFNCGSSSIEIDGLEQEEAATCLIMLSRDSTGVDSFVESCDNNSVVRVTKSSSTEIRKKGRLNDGENECRKLKDSNLDAKTVEMENSDSGYFLDECGKVDSDVSVDWFRPNHRFEGSGKEYTGDDGVPSNLESRKRRFSPENHEQVNESVKIVKEGVDLCNNSQKKSKYECFNCKKNFKSYQALGGHRPCHKRSNAASESRDESDDNSPDDSTYYRKPNSSKKSKPKKSKGYVCPFCNRVFKNGQALGGHKRSHFIGGNRVPMLKPDPSDLLDLNLPAPEANEDDGSG